MSISSNIRDVIRNASLYEKNKGKKEKKKTGL